MQNVHQIDDDGIKYVAAQASLPIGPGGGQAQWVFVLEACEAQAPAHAHRGQDIQVRITWMQLVALSGATASRNPGVCACLLPVLFDLTAAPTIPLSTLMHAIKMGNAVDPARYVPCSLIEQGQCAQPRRGPGLLDVRQAQGALQGSRVAHDQQEEGRHDCCLGGTQGPAQVGQHSSKGS